MGSPHLEEEWVGGNVDLDLLPQILNTYASLVGGIKIGASFSRSAMEEREGKNEQQLNGEEGGFL
jgi:hypothetical protein